jgi:hypothetical protein
MSMFVLVPGAWMLTALIELADLLDDLDAAEPRTAASESVAR